MAGVRASENIEHVAGVQGGRWTRATHGPARPLKLDMQVWTWAGAALQIPAREVTISSPFVKTIFYLY